MAVLQPSGPVYNPAYFDLKPLEGMFRGGHYHRNLTEILYIIRGSCRIRYVDLETGEKGTVEAGAGDLVTISPGCAHQLQAIDFLRAIEYSKQDVVHQDDTFLYDFS
jgi:dTDP-4-dehydrorhamnose 3,5-epimerase-like enzyme